MTLRKVVKTDVLGLHIGPIFKVQAVQKNLTLEDGADRQSRNVRFKPPYRTVRNNAEDGRIQFNRGGRLC